MFVIKAKTFRSSGHHLFRSQRWRIKIYPIYDPTQSHIFVKRQKLYLLIQSLHGLSLKYQCASFLKTKTLPHGFNHSKNGLINIQIIDDDKCFKSSLVR